MTTGTSEATVTGLMAAGEGACVSVHGANRLGANSLLDIIVFGRAVANTIVAEVGVGTPHRALAAGAGEESIEKIARLLGRSRSIGGKAGGGGGGSGTGTGAGSGTDFVSATELREEMQGAMEEHVGVYRTAEGLEKGIGIVEGVFRALPRVRLTDTSRVMNTELTEALELENMAMQSVVTAHSARGRQESRGAHAREDFPKRDDRQWLRHTLGWMDKETGKVRLGYRPVHLFTLDSSEVAPIQPTERSY